MKRTIALPAAILSATLVFTACAGSDASMQPGDSTIAIPSTSLASTTTTQEPVSSFVPATDPATTASTVPATTNKPAPTTTVKSTTPTTVKSTTPTTVKKPSGTTQQLAQQAATSLGNAVDVALREGDRAPIFKSIWDKYAAAGLTITIPVSERAPDNPSGLPSFASIYQVSGNGQTFCLIWAGGSTYVTNPGACG